MKAALTRYRVLAYTTGVLLVLLTLHVVLQVVEWQTQNVPYSQTEGLNDWVPGSGTVIPIAHGWIYLVYVVVTADLWFRTRLPLGRTVLVVLAGTVPFMSFVAERWVTNRVRPMIEAGEQSAAGAPVG